MDTDTAALVGAVLAFALGSVTTYVSGLVRDASHQHVHDILTCDGCLSIDDTAFAEGVDSSEFAIRLMERSGRPAIVIRNRDADTPIAPV